MSITTWSRIEPDVESMDPAEGLTRGLANRIADPLWLLGRQRALGELRGEDAGLPVTAELVVASHAATALTIGGVAHPVAAGVPWEAAVEAEPDAVDARLRIRGGELFATLLEEAGLVDAIANARDKLGWPAVGASDELTGAAAVAVGAAARRWPDGAAVAAAYEDGTLPKLLRLTPEQLSGPSKEWSAWWSARARVKARTAWQAERLEHAFGVQVPTAAGRLTLAADRYGGGRLDWDAFRVAAVAPTGAAAPSLATVVATPMPLTVPGMATVRAWELEDEHVDLGRVSLGPGDLGGALLVEAALAYAGDWFVIPVALDAGALHRITSVQLTDSFGVRSVVRAADVVRPDAAWALWRLTGDDTHGLLVPQATAATLVGELVEDVALVRDELANAGWAIERVVPDTLGRGRRVAHPADDGAAAATEADWRYRPLPRLPGDRVPLVWRHDSDGARLVRAGVVDASMGVPSVAGRLLAAEFAAREEELGRTGVVVTRRWQVALDASGGRHAWCTRARAPGSPMAGVRVAFDELVPASSPPPPGAG